MGLLTEYIFANAVALNESGRLRNSIFVHGHQIFILNGDNTVILSFRLPSSEPTLEGPIGFAAADYDSDAFEEQNGQIIFRTKGVNWNRQKICRSSDVSFADVEKIFGDYVQKAYGHMNMVTFYREDLTLLEDNLSHIEFVYENNDIHVVQRDIYSGNKIVLTRPPATGLAVTKIDKLETKGFAPFAIRTNDFMALFIFNEKIELYFHADANENPFCMIKGEKFGMHGVLATCVYDQLGEIGLAGKENDHGRKKPQNRRSEQKTGPTPDASATGFTRTRR